LLKAGAVSEERDTQHYRRLALVEFFDQRNELRLHRRHNPCCQNVGIKQVSERIWLVTFMDYDLGYFDDQTCRLEPLENPFGPKVLPMSPV
jgi:hypothetical protein